MARFYADISKRYDKFFEKDTYHLNRAVNVNVNGDKVNWAIETKVDSNNKVDSKLTVKHDIGRENFQIETSTSKNPKIAVTTTRLPFAKTKVSLAEPKLEVEFSKQVEKFAWNAKASNDWKAATWEAESSLSYQANANVTLGAKFAVDQNKSKTVRAKDYNFKFEWQRNPDQTLVVTTDRQLSCVKLGGFATLRENYVGFGQVEWDKNESKKLGWEAGIEKRINEASTATGIIRQGSRGSILYKGKIDKFEGHLAYNLDLEKSPDERHSLEYKLCFNF